MKKNNILSYFIKDIKDPLELIKYRQENTRYFIKLYYNDKLLYRHIIMYNFIDNYIKNIYKAPFNTSIYTAIIHSDKSLNYKQFYYNKDNIINNISSNFIAYRYYKKFYTFKLHISYRNNNGILLSIIIKYYNGFKYMYYNSNYRSITNNFVYKSLILIMNKYELQYISRFFLSLII